MGNPKRYILDDKHHVYGVRLDTDKKEISFASRVPIETFEKLDFYSAPDVIFRYHDGSDNRDEWRRYYIWKFENAKKVSSEKCLDDESFSYLFSYDSFEDILTHKLTDDIACERDIPMGRFMGMTEEQIRNWKRKSCFGKDPQKRMKELLKYAIRAQKLWRLHWEKKDGKGCTRQEHRMVAMLTAIQHEYEKMYGEVPLQEINEFGEVNA